MTEDEMFGWHHQLNGHGFGWTPGVRDGQGGLVCCSSRGYKELDMTEHDNDSLHCVKENVVGPTQKTKMCKAVFDVGEITVC